MTGNNGPIAEGATLVLAASSAPGANYSWTGPNGFASSDQNPAIANASVGNSGTYGVTASIGICTSAVATTTVTVNPLLVLSMQVTNNSLGAQLVRRHAPVGR